jgi:hypothetical protein
VPVHSTAVPESPSSLVLQIKISSNRGIGSVTLEYLHDHNDGLIANQTRELQIQQYAGRGGDDEVQDDVSVAQYPGICTYVSSWLGWCELLERISKMSAKILRIVLAFLAVFAILSTVCADRLSDIAKRRGYNEKIVKKRVAGEAAPKLRNRAANAAATSSVCTTASPPNPTKP